MSVIQKERLDRLEKAVEKVGTSKDYYIRKINKKIERYIEDLEDLAAAQESYAEIEAGAETIPHEEIKAKYGL